jgi:hypothetical protein
MLQLPVVPSDVHKWLINPIILSTGVRKYDLL